MLTAGDDACTDGCFSPDGQELCGSVPLRDKTIALTEAQRHGGKALIADDDACTDGSFSPDDQELCGSVPL